MGKGPARGSGGLRRPRGCRRHGGEHPGRREAARRVSAHRALGAPRSQIGEDGKTELPGADVIDRIFESSLRAAATRRPQNEREDLRREIREAISDGARASEIGRSFENLDSGWVFPAPDDERLDLLLESA